MANDKQLTASDIKGDLAQRLRCPVCTIPFNQTQGRNKIELDRLETKESSKRAISFVCDDCKAKGTKPEYGLRLIIASDGSQIVNEVRVEDLPLIGSNIEAESKAANRRGTRGNRTRTRGGRKAKKTTPTENPTASGALEAARPQIKTLDE